MTSASYSFSNASEVALEFDRWAQVGRGDSMAAGHRYATQQLIDDLAIADDSVVLDAGCGVGWVLNDLLGPRIEGGVGIDLSPEMIAIANARRTLPHLEFAVADSTDTGLEDGTFSHVVSIEVLYYTPDPLKTLAEWRRVVRSGGRVGLVLDLYRDNPAASHWIEALPISAHNLSVAEWQDLLKSAGWDDIKAQCLPLPLKIPQDAFTPSAYFPEYDIYRGYCEAGSLLITARKLS